MAVNDPLTEYQKQLRRRSLAQMGLSLMAGATSGRPGIGLLSAARYMPQPVDPMAAMQYENALAARATAAEQAAQLQSQQTAGAKLFGGRDPATGITWNTGRPGLMGTPEGGSLLAQVDPAGMASKMISPDVREMREGDQRVTAERDPMLGAWNELASGEQWNPRQRELRSASGEQAGTYSYRNIMMNGKPVRARTHSKGGTVEIQTPGGDWQPAPKGHFAPTVGYTTRTTPSGAQAIIDPTGPTQVYPTPPTGPRLPTAGTPPGVEFAAGTGGSGFVGNIANTVTDMFGIGLQAPKAEQSARALKALMVQTNLQLTADMPGRPSNYIRQRLAELEVTPNSLLQGDERSKIKMQEIKELIAEEYNRLRDTEGVENSRLLQLHSQFDEILGQWGQAPGGAGVMRPGDRRNIGGVEVERIE